MSESQTTRTKTGSVSSVTESSLDDYVDQDRWTHNISYHQLIVSTCVGIVQLWWHPYIHDLTKLLPFLFLYNIFSILIGYPMLYLELALGILTRKGVLNCWDLAPAVRGLGVSMLLACAFTAIALSTVAAWCLALFVHSFHSFLPWLHCAAGSNPACAARHRPMSNSSETPAQSFFFNFILKLKRDGLDTGMGTVVAELSTYFVLCWILVYFICIKRIYSYSKLVLFKDTLAYLVLVCCAVGATRLDGAGRMLRDAQWNVLAGDFEIYIEAAKYALIEVTASQGSLIMLGVYCPKKKYPLLHTVTIAFAASKTSSITAALILGAAHGALIQDYEHVTNIQKGSSASMILWADFVARIPGSQFWSAIVFFTLHVLALSSTALLVQTIMSSITGKFIRKAKWALLIVLCVLFCLTGIITLCTQGGLYILNFLMWCPAQTPRLFIVGCVLVTITFSYGQSVFCEDVFFAVEEYPCVFMRVCWAIAPAVLGPVFLTDMFFKQDQTGRVLMLVIVSPFFLILILYMVFKCRVRDITTENKN